MSTNMKEFCVRCSSLRMFGAFIFVVLIYSWSILRDPVFEASTWIDSSNNTKYMYKTQINIDLIEVMLNAQTNSSIYCDPFKYKYTKLLLKEINDNIIDKKSTKLKRKKTTSAEINNDVKNWKNSVNRKRVHITIINNTLYANSQFVKSNQLYFRSIYEYLKSFMKKYGKYTPDTDFIWQCHDGKEDLKYDKINWMLNNTVPYFFCDINTTETDYLSLFLIDRGYMKYRYLSNYLYNKYNGNIKNINQKKDRVVTRQIKKFLIDYFDFKSAENTLNRTAFNFGNKPINKAFFVGNSRWSASRREFFEFISNTSDSDKYFVVHDVNFNDPKHKYISIDEQLKYKYIISLDGFSVRDSLIYQMEFGAVTFKQISPFYSFWHFDLINNYNIILFKSFDELYYIVKTIVYPNGTRDKSLLSNNSNIDSNQVKYTEQSLKNITINAKTLIYDSMNDTNIDCYFLQMIQIYNEFLYDSTTITLAHNMMKI